MSDLVADPGLLVPGNRVRLLRDGAEAYPAMLEAIASARHSVLLEMYTFAGDETGRKFADALAAAAKRGVQVRILYDAVGSGDTPTTQWSTLRLAGAAITPYRPALWFTLRKRDHRKILVVDGRLGYAGGLNLADAYRQSWRDTHLEIEGPVVRELVDLFAETWEREEDDPLWRPDPPPVAPAVGDVAVGVFASNGWRDRRSIGRAYLHAIRRARKRIWISNAYFMPSFRFLRALRQARQRGVDVRVLVPRETDAWPVYYASRSLFGYLLKHRVRVFEWKGAMLHAKTAVIDDVWTTVGSYNLDHLSFARNLEISIVVDGAACASEKARMYEEDLANADEVDAVTWSRRPFKQRLLEAFWRIFQSAL